MQHIVHIWEVGEREEGEEINLSPKLVDYSN